VVTVAAVQKTDVPVYISTIGNVTPKQTITIVSQVSGQLTKILFKDGQLVKAGDLLAEIDSRPYKALVSQYEGQLVRDMALLKNAKIDLQRYQILWQQNSVAKQVLDTQKALVSQYEGTVKLDRAMIDSAKVNLSYCRITSPINGQVGLHQVDEGNIVQASPSTNIAIVNTINPILVTFDITESDLHKLLVKYNQNKNLEVTVYGKDQKQLLASGNLLAIDNQINIATGTVGLKATFSNDDSLLFPNQFVNVKLLIETVTGALTVPTAAIQKGPKGTFVYRVKKGNKVRIVPIETGPTYSGNVVVNTGLSEGDIVVIDGVDKLTDGVVVKIGGNS
jgi:multidrug efflux system membrane fusion protein